MSVVSLSHVSVVRARKSMEQAFLNDDWDAVKDYDQLLAEQLNRAFDDPNRDNSGLVNELEKILNLYAQMVDVLPESTAQQWLRPELIQ